MVNPLGPQQQHSEGVGDRQDGAGFAAPTGGNLWDVLRIVRRARRRPVHRLAAPVRPRLPEIPAGLESHGVCVVLANKFKAAGDAELLAGLGEPPHDLPPWSVVNLGSLGGPDVRDERQRRAAGWVVEVSTENYGTVPRVAGGIHGRQLDVVVPPLLSHRGAGCVQEHPPRWSFGSHTVAERQPSYMGLRSDRRKNPFVMGVFRWTTEPFEDQRLKVPVPE